MRSRRGWSSAEIWHPSRDGLDIYRTLQAQFRPTRLTRYVGRFVADHRMLGELVGNDVIQQAWPTYPGCAQGSQDAIAYDAPGVYCTATASRATIHKTRVVSGIIDGRTCGGDPLFNLGRFSLTARIAAILLMGMAGAGRLRWRSRSRLSGHLSHCFTRGAATGGIGSPSAQTIEATSPSRLSPARLLVTR